MTNQCRYRQQKYECEAMGSTIFCDLCLKGQIIDSVELLTSTVMERSIDKLEDTIKNCQNCRYDSRDCMDIPCKICSMHSEWKEIP